MTLSFVVLHGYHIATEEVNSLRDLINNMNLQHLYADFFPGGALISTALIFPSYLC